MKFFEIEYSIDLLEINKRIEKEKDRNIIIQLLKDKKYILKYLGSSPKNEEFLYKKKLDEKEVKHFLSFNPLSDKKVNGIRIYNINNIKLKELTKEFIEKSKFKLFSTYKKINEYNGLKLVNTNSKYFGSTMYFKSLDKNYILVKKSNGISHYSTIIHELGHARANHIRNDSGHKFEETYSIFLELVYADWIYKNGFIKEAYNIKNNLLIQVKQFFLELNYELRSYIYRGEEHSFDNYIFEYKYNILKDIILAFYLYDLYLNNPKETLIRIDYFILNSNKMTEDELLKIFDMDNSIFYNKEKIQKKLLSSIEKEKKLISKNVKGIIKK